MKNISIIIFDIFVILVPFFFVDHENFNYISITLLTVSCLCILGTIIAEEKTLLNMIKDRNLNPYWWKYYDITTDIMFIASWLYIKEVLVVMFYIVSKALIEIKIEKYKRGTL